MLRAGLSSGGYLILSQPTLSSNIEVGLRLGFMVFLLSNHLCRVTILKDRETRESKGVAFILYTNREDAQNAVSYQSRINGSFLLFMHGLPYVRYRIFI